MMKIRGGETLHAKSGKKDKQIFVTNSSSGKDNLQEAISFLFKNRG